LDPIICFTFISPAHNNSEAIVRRRENEGRRKESESYHIRSSSIGFEENGGEVNRPNEA
jgi:hypothetical protein